MIRIITTKRLRYLEAIAKDVAAWKNAYNTEKHEHSLTRRLYEQKLYQPTPATEGRDIGAENRRRNAERMMRENQQARRAAEEDIPSTFPGLWSLGPETSAEAKPATLFGSAPDDSYAGGGATASYGDSSSCSSSSSSDSSSSSSDCSSSSSSTTND